MSARENLLVTSIEKAWDYKCPDIPFSAKFTLQAFTPIEFSSPDRATEFAWKIELFNRTEIEQRTDKGDLASPLFCHQQCIDLEPDEDPDFFSHRELMWLSTLNFLMQDLDLGDSLQEQMLKCDYERILREAAIHYSKALVKLLKDENMLEEEPVQQWRRVWDLRGVNV